VSIDAAYFDTLYAEADPWGYRTRWYEQRKRTLLLAALHRPRYRRGLELACSIGETTASLAMRCAQLVATDGNPTAVRRARRRTASMPDVSVEHMRLPAQWPPGTFDLVVFSEFGYYLEAADLDATVARIRGCLDDDAMVLACHWRRPVQGCPHDGDAVHERIDRMLRLPRILHHEEQDMRLDGWTPDGRSVASSGGLA
jgi:cyclopropane fatty-acyl-phospholipid synthase-like methyltransferase